MLGQGLLGSFFVAGFECSTHRRRDGRRLDLLAATRHDELAAEDYRSVVAHGMRAARDGLRWHLIEAGAPGRYDWSSFLPMLRAARGAGVQVVWDLCHYGWPDGLDIWAPEFVDRFARFAEAAARVVRDETDGTPFYCPINEISYWAWAGGDARKFAPAAKGRGGELKRQLARASIAAIDAVRGVDPRARIVHAEPLINIVPHSAKPAHTESAAEYHAAQYQSLDMLCGRLAPELGGRSEYLDVVGVNFYPDNQWKLPDLTVGLGHHLYRPFRSMLAEIYARYGRPVLITETGAEGTAKPAWLHYVASEVHAAQALGVPVQGICLYPILEYPGWENERHCEVGLLSVPDADGRRCVDGPLAEELARQQAIFAATSAARDERPARVRLVG